jgi:hypothetical protein
VSIYSDVSVVVLFLSVFLRLYVSVCVVEYVLLLRLSICVCKCLW